VSGFAALEAHGRLLGRAVPVEVASLLAPAAAPRLGLDGGKWVGGGGLEIDFGRRRLGG
jgi:hypothetical protein